MKVYFSKQKGQHLKPTETTTLSTRLGCYFKVALWPEKMNKRLRSVKKI